jgi:hypothetical protein
MFALFAFLYLSTCFSPLAHPFFFSLWFPIHIFVPSERRSILKTGAQSTHTHTYTHIHTHTRAHYHHYFAADVLRFPMYVQMNIRRKEAKGGGRREHASAKDTSTLRRGQWERRKERHDEEMGHICINGSYIALPAIFRFSFYLVPTHDCCASAPAPPVLEVLRPNQSELTRVEIAVVTRTNPGHIPPPPPLQQQLQGHP